MLQEEKKRKLMSFVGFEDKLILAEPTGSFSFAAPHEGSVSLVAAHHHCRVMKISLVPPPAVRVSSGQVWSRPVQSSLVQVGLVWFITSLVWFSLVWSGVV